MYSSSVQEEPLPMRTDLYAVEEEGVDGHEHGARKAGEEGEAGEEAKDAKDRVCRDDRRRWRGGWRTQASCQSYRQISWKSLQQQELYR